LLEQPIILQGISVHEVRCSNLKFADEIDIIIEEDEEMLEEMS